MAFGLPISSEPHPDVPWSLAELRKRLLREEVWELACAIDEGDLSAIARELADVIYVTYGTAVTLGFPVAVKAASDEILHKTERGLVYLGIESDQDLNDAIVAIQTELGGEAKIVVQEMVEGLEVILGARTSPTFGPVVLLGAGGIFVELVRSTATGIAPLSSPEVAQMIERTVVGDLLAGYRGGPPGDREALIQAVRSFSQLAWDIRGELHEMEINPLIVLPEGRGVKAVDVVVTRKDV